MLLRVLVGVERLPQLRGHMLCAQEDGGQGTPVGAGLDQGGRPRGRGLGEQSEERDIVPNKGGFACKGQGVEESTASQGAPRPAKQDLAGLRQRPEHPQSQSQPPACAHWVLDSWAPSSSLERGQGTAGNSIIDEKWLPEEAQRGLVACPQSDRTEIQARAWGLGSSEAATRILFGGGVQAGPKGGEEKVRKRRGRKDITEVNRFASFNRLRESLTQGLDRNPPGLPSRCNP